MVTLEEHVSFREMTALTPSDLLTFLDRDSKIRAFRVGMPKNVFTFAQVPLLQFTYYKEVKNTKPPKTPNNH